MPRYIDADALEEAIQKFPYGYRGVIKSVIAQMPSALPDTCEYWDVESNFCTLHRPSAQPTADAVERKEGYIVSFEDPETAADIISAALAAYDAGLYDLLDDTVQSATDLLNRISLQL